MRKSGSLKTNVILNAILKVSEFLFPLITFPYVSRILLAEGIGKVNFATSVISYFLMFAQLGIPTYGIRECARVRDDKRQLTNTVYELFIINIITSLIAYAALFTALFTVPRFSQDRTLFAIASLTIMFNCIGMEWLYQSLEMYKYITIRSLIFKAVAMAAMFIFIHSQDDYVIYGAITIFAVSASNILNFINLHNLIYIKQPFTKKTFNTFPKQDVSNDGLHGAEAFGGSITAEGASSAQPGLSIRRHLKPVFVFFAMSCATTVYMNLDNVMLGFMKGDSEVGFYSAAVKIKVILVSVVTSLGVVLLTRASYYLEHDQHDEFARITRKAMNFVVLLAAPVSLYFLLFARECIYILSGENFEGSVIPMIVIMPTVFFIGMSNVTGIQVLLPLGREKIVLYSEIIGAVIDFIINLLLIPHLASTGAAIGTLAAEIIVWVFQIIFLHRSFPGIYKGIRFGVIAAALAIAVAASWWVRWMPFGNLLKLIISVILFFGLYMAVLLIFKESLVREVLLTIRRKLMK